jgi:hypothetical protein
MNEKILNDTIVEHSVKIEFLEKECSLRKKRCDQYDNRITKLEYRLQFFAFIGAVAGGGLVSISKHVPEIFKFLLSFAVRSFNVYAG